MPDYQGTRTVPRLELGEAGAGFIQSQDEFIGTKVLPIFQTKRSEYLSGDHAGEVSLVRRIQARAPRVTWQTISGER